MFLRKLIRINVKFWRFASYIIAARCNTNKQFDWLIQYNGNNTYVYKSRKEELSKHFNITLICINHQRVRLRWYDAINKYHEKKNTICYLLTWFLFILLSFHIYILYLNSFALCANILRVSQIYFLSFLSLNWFNCICKIRLRWVNGILWQLNYYFMSFYLKFILLF